MGINIYLTGVGGQGLITFASVLGQAAVDAGLNVTVAETHGLSQRGGAVDVHVRVGKGHSPLIPIGGADVVVSFELIEALRAIPYINPNTVMIVNRRLIPPPTLRGNLPNPGYIESALRKLPIKVYLINAYDHAVKIGNPIFENMVMLGASYALTGIRELISREVIENAIIKVITKAKAENLRAFRVGLTAAIKDVE